MKTIRDSGQRLISIRTNETRKEIALGKLHVTFVQYRTYEYSREELEKGKGTFLVHDSNCEEAKDIAAAVAL